MLKKKSFFLFMKTDQRRKKRIDNWIINDKAGVKEAVIEKKKLETST